MNMNLQPLLNKAVHRTLTESDAREAALALMSGTVLPAQAGGLLSALRARGESLSEIVGFARALRENADPFPLEGDDLLDTCGTGGDGLSTFNVSTLSGLVVAACGVRVAKHGNRAVSSRCGSADLLEAIGICVDVAPAVAARCIEETGFGFLFAPRYHPMLRSLGPLRRELGFRSIFNLAGPLANPARVGLQLVGVPAMDLLRPVAEAVHSLGARRAFVVHGHDGSDEVSITGATAVLEVGEDGVTSRVIHPEDAGLVACRPEAVVGADAATNALAAMRLLEGERGPLHDFVVLNAGAALMVAGETDLLRTGAEMAREALLSGRARRVVDVLRRLTAEAA